jgi:hypothetical protein
LIAAVASVGHNPIFRPNLFNFSFGLIQELRFPTKYGGLAAYGGDLERGSLY